MRLFMYDAYLSCFLLRRHSFSIPNYISLLLFFLQWFTHIVYYRKYTNSPTVFQSYFLFSVKRRPIMVKWIWSWQVDCRTLIFINIAYWTFKEVFSTMFFEELVHFYVSLFKVRVVVNLWFLKGLYLLLLLLPTSTWSALFCFLCSLW